MRPCRAAALAVAAGLLLPSVAFACMWDYDTIKEESLGDKDGAAVVKGVHHNHNAAFYAAQVSYTPAIGERKSSAIHPLASTAKKTFFGKGKNQDSGDRRQGGGGEGPR